MHPINWRLTRIGVGWLGTQDLGGTRKLGSSIIHQAFQGSVQVTTRPFKPKDEDSPQASGSISSSDKAHDDPVSVENLPFLYAISASQVSMREAQPSHPCVQIPLHRAASSSPIQRRSREERDSAGAPLHHTTEVRRSNGAGASPRLLTPAPLEIE
jgi:hypothetical protein